MFIESWNNEMVGVGGEKQRYKLTPGIRSSSGTRNSNKLLVDGGCCTQVLRGVGRRRRRRERIPLWNGDRASDGLVHSIPENLSVFILALGISLEILHTHRRPSHTFPIWIFFIDSNLISRSLFLLLFLFLLFSLSYRRSRFRSNLITRKISLFLLLLLLFFSSCTKRYQVPEDNTSRGLYRVETYHGHERINGDRYSRPIS